MHYTQFAILERIHHRRRWTRGTASSGLALNYSDRQNDLQEKDGAAAQ